MHVFERHQGGFTLVDLQSGNGTYVNGRKIASIDLYDGDIVVIGKTKMLFESVGWRRSAGPRKPWAYVWYCCCNGHSVDPSKVGLVTLMASFVTVFCMGLLRIPSVDPVTDALDKKIQAVNAALAQQNVGLAELNLGHAQVISQLLEGREENIQKLAVDVEQARRFAHLKTALGDGIPMTALKEEVSATLENGGNQPRGPAAGGRVDKSPCRETTARDYTLNECGSERRGCAPAEGRSGFGTCRPNLS